MQISGNDMTDVVTWYYVHGITSRDDVEQARRAVLGVANCRDVEFDLKQATARIRGDVDPQAVCLVLMQTGFPAVVKSD